MMYELYKGYVLTQDKKSMMPFKGKSSDELLNLKQASVLSEYAGILNDQTVLVDIDNQEQADILFDIVKELGVNCKVIRTTKGRHFLFHSNKPMVNKTGCKLAIGIKADIKGGGRASYEVLKFNNQLREVEYDQLPYDEVPKWLYPVKSNIDLLGLDEGEGRNNALFSYILPLQKCDFTVEECRETIGIVNRFVLKHPVSDNELDVILRDGAFDVPMFFTDHGGFLFNVFGDYITHEANVVKINGQLAIYNEGVYEIGTKTIERTMLQYIPNLTQNRRREVLSYLDITAKDVSLDKFNTMIAFENGVLDVITMEFHEFSPEYVITNKIPHCYNPSAKSELLERTIGNLACHDQNTIDLLYEAVGYNFLRKNELRKSFFLLGAKRNGKSTFLDMVQTLLGEENVANLDLSEIGDRFRTAELTDKLANIGDDIADDWVANTSIFKKVVSGDVITVEKKGKDPYKLHSYAKFFFSANSLPRLGKGRDSQAVMDRLVLISFDATFSKDDPDFDPFIKYKLREEDVIEALIVKGVEGLRRVLANNEFTSTEKGATLINEYEYINNPFKSYVDGLDPSEWLRCPIKDVYRRYSVFCAESHLQNVSALEFQRQLKEMTGVKVKTIEINNKKVKVYDFD